MARAIWKGVVTFGKVRIPVRFYSGVEDRGVHFRLLHSKDKMPISQRMVNAKTEESVPAERIRKGFELDDGIVVMLDSEEIETVQPEPSRDVEITRFVEPSAIAPQFYDRPYWVGPDGESAAYFALAEALARTGRHGIARWTMRKKRYVGALRSDGEHLSMIALRYADEVVAATEIAAPPGRELQPAERRMAEQLVAALEGPFDPTEFRDEFRARVLDLVKKKAKGVRVKLPRPKVVAPRETSLESALQASLEATRERKSA
jgi:DNA end-binding protein Ku